MKSKHEEKYKLSKKYKNYLNQTLITVKLLNGNRF